MELLAALVDSFSERVATSAAFEVVGIGCPWFLDEPDALFHSGVGDPDNSLGISALESLFGVVAMLSVFSNTWEVGVTGSRFGAGGDVANMLGVSGVPTTFYSD